MLVDRGERAIFDTQIPVLKVKGLNPFGFTSIGA